MYIIIRKSLILLNLYLINWIRFISNYLPGAIRLARMGSLEGKLKLKVPEITMQCNTMSSQYNFLLEILSPTICRFLPLFSFTLWVLWTDVPSTFPHQKAFFLNRSSPYTPNHQLLPSLIGVTAVVISPSKAPLAFNVRQTWQGAACTSECSWGWLGGGPFIWSVLKKNKTKKNPSRRWDGASCAMWWGENSAGRPNYFK